MNTSKALLFIVFSALMFSAGCGKQQQYKTLERICVSHVGRAEAMQAAEEVLVRMHFTVDKVDVENGLLRTRPLSAAKVFEFWRSDSVGAFNFAEANLHSIRRIAELNISQGWEDRQLCIACDVKTQRLSLPQGRTDSGLWSAPTFSESGSLMRRLKPSDEQRKVMSWIDLGSDARLATQILNRIKDKM